MSEDNTTMSTNHPEPITESSVVGISAGDRLVVVDNDTENSNEWLSAKEGSYVALPASR